MNSKVKDKKAEITNSLIDSDKISIFNKVDKSNLLLANIKVPLSLNSYKLLDLYLSLINLGNSASGEINIRKRDFERILGIDRIRLDQLRKLCDEISSLKVTVGLNPDNYGDVPVNMFSYFTAIVEPETRQNIIIAKCNPDAKKLFFDGGAIDSIKYQLKVTLDLKSEYSIRLYIYLRSNLFFYSNGNFRRKWDIKFNKLRAEIYCKSYENSFKDFNDKVLKKAQTEINEKTDLAFEYSYSRTTQTISFSITRFNNSIFLEESGKAEQSEPSEKDKKLSEKSEIEQEVKSQIDFDGLVKDGYSEKYLNLIVKTICETMSKAEKDPEGKMKIDGNFVVAKDTAERFRTLKKEHIACVLDTLDEVRKTTQIKNIKSYLKTMLFNADENIMPSENCKKAENQKKNSSYDINDLSVLDYIDSI